MSSLLHNSLAQQSKDFLNQAMSRVLALQLQ